MAFRDEFPSLSAELSRHGANAALQPVEPLMALDAATGELVALAPATEADESVTAVFAWRRNRWRSEGRIVAGLTPAQTLHHHRDRLIAA
ncbi:hypothetical protein [Botrimarina sp.]|uniref:hypothetical protein n=1 Tax=Botrimarina sp. TaxID=2795802 RepID=UPI0032EE6903